MSNQNERSPEQRMRRKFVIFLAGATIIFLILFFAGVPALSTALTNIIISELQDISGERVTIGSLQLRLFPLSIEAKDVTVSGENGENILAAGRVKGYLGLGELLARTVSLRRIVVGELHLTAEREKFEEVVRHVRAYLERERKDAVKVTVKAVEIVSGDIHVADRMANGTLDVKGLSGELIIGEAQRVRTAAREITVEREGWPKIVCDVSSAFVLKKDGIEIKSLRIGASGSSLEGKGRYERGEGSLDTRLSLLMSSLKQLFGLKKNGEGQIMARGEMRIEREGGKTPSLRQESLVPPAQLHAEKAVVPRIENIFADLNVEGQFSIESLMELLHVKERIEGAVDFHGVIRGPLSNLTGRARATLEKGNLFGVEIDTLTCTVIYANREMKFEEVYGRLYNGTARADAAIHLPVVDQFSVSVKFQSIDSEGAFRLIGWDPGISRGKVDGELLTAGAEFSPSGWFIFRAPGGQGAAPKGQKPLPSDNVLHRVTDMRGNYSLDRNRLSLTNVEISTGVSRISAQGTIDLASESLNLTSRLVTENISDLTSPYYVGADGRGEFSGEVSGSFDDPIITGRWVLTNPGVEGYRADRFLANFSYQKHMLHLRDAVLQSAGYEHRMKGRISFPQASDLFDLAMPVYDLSMTLRRADFERVVKIFYREFVGSGMLSADLRIGGSGKDIDVSGTASVERASLYGVPFDSVASQISYERQKLSLKQAKLIRGQSMLGVDGRIHPDKGFSFRAASDRIRMVDFGLERMPDDAMMSVRSEGSGTFENPFITLHADVAGGTFKGRNMGSGTVDAVIENRDIRVKAALFHEKMKLTGHGILDEKVPWNAELVIEPARYDFLVSALLKDVPEDLQVNLEGKINMQGDKRHFEASALIHRLSLLLFGQAFANDSDIRFSVMDNKISLKPFVIKGGEASFGVRGNLEIGKEYDIHLDGSAALAPLKGLSKRIGYLRGDANFVIAVTGKWEEPDIKGGVTISDASFGLKGYAAYVSSISGYIYVDDDRIIVEKLSGKFGGGTVDISGFAYLKGFLIKRFHLEAHLDNLTAKVLPEFSVNFDGNLLYRGTPDAMYVNGDIRIKKARYRQPVEWRSWLLTAKSMEKPRSEMSVFEQAELNIQVSGSENISVDNNIARAPIRIRGDMIVKGTVSNPVLFGRLESNEGYMYFRNNEFRVIYASADFADPYRIKPILNLTAETSMKGYTIRLNLEGEMDRFNLSLSSDPPLEEVDILSLLTVGQLGKQTKGLEGGIGAGTATSFITGKQQDIIEERIRALTGIDRFQVEPYVSKLTGTVEPRVTVSERLIGDKVFVTYTTSIGSTEEQILKVEYLLGKKVSLIGTRDEKGSIGGDVKFRFEFK